jgi:hypothetical protein
MWEVNNKLDFVLTHGVYPWVNTKNWRFKMKTIHRAWINNLIGQKLIIGEGK